MIYVGLDDTDMPELPGTNKLARHLCQTLENRCAATLIVRHQLLNDPRVPCTNKNGCAAIVLTSLVDEPLEALIATLRKAIVAWVPEGSDPGLCVTCEVPLEISAFGRRCQHELVTQGDARKLAERFGIFLEGLGGTEDGVIGALAAVGLVASANDGRVVYRGDLTHDAFELGAIQPVEEVLRRGVDEIRCVDSGQPIRSGMIDLGKRLRPNLREGKVVLFAASTGDDSSSWNAVRMV